MKAVEKLALVFMNPFHLDVEEGVGVDVDFVFPLKVCREFQLVFLQIEEAEDSPGALASETPTISLFPLTDPGKQMLRSSPAVTSLSPCTKADITNHCQHSLHDSR